MFISFLDELRKAGIQASPKEHLALLEALQADVIAPNPEEFYYLARTVYIKDESLIDRFDQVFGKVFKGVLGTEETRAEIPEAWLRAVTEMFLTAEERAAIEALGSWE